MLAVIIVPVVLGVILLGLCYLYLLRKHAKRRGNTKPYILSSTTMVKLNRQSSFTPFANKPQASLFTKYSSMVALLLDVKMHSFIYLRRKDGQRQLLFLNTTTRLSDHVASPTVKNQQRRCDILRTKYLGSCNR